MILLVFFLWIMSTILFLTNSQNEETRWGSLIAFFGGCGGFGVMVGDGPNRPEWILWIDSLFTSFGHYMTPYAILIFGLTFAKAFKTTNQRIIWKILFLIPVIFMYNIDQLYPVFKTNYTLLSLWTVPYVMGANILLVYSTYLEARPAIKKHKIFTCLVIIPPITFALFTNIILEACGIPDVWLCDPWIIALQFLLFAYLIVKYGFLDVRVRFEKQRRDTTMKSITSGTAMLNHTIKNELAKIDMLVNQLKDHVILDETAAENIELALESTHHVLKLSSRIQNKLDFIYLKESEFWLSEVIDSAIYLLQPYLNSDINIIKNYEVDVKVLGDSIHLQETFLNIIKNAIEAMESKGEIVIKIYKTKRKLFIDFKDSGKGIKKDELLLVLNPFYSTKGTKEGNYGLGLTYCYNVMQKHHGDITMKSKLGQGTTFTLSFPSKRIIELTY
ncbi:sensor histidine kinase [Bacillus cereus group sp. MYBK132-2]|uniref:sensor histidine kinase n=1 Tax=unclassified Bacillus cereus group TaxID=2750818 RepID=UPI003F7B24B6